MIYFVLWYLIGFLTCVYRALFAPGDRPLDVYDFLVTAFISLLGPPFTLYAVLYGIREHIIENRRKKRQRIA